MSIPPFSLKDQIASIRTELDEAIAGVLDSGQFILGPNVKALEAEVAAYAKVDHGVGVASGTDAIRLALQAINIGPGDEVITTPFTFVATSHAIMRCGGKPVFADIEPDTWNMDPASVEAAITPKTKAILAVHIYGHPCEMAPLKALADKHGLKIIEDAAQAFGAAYDGVPVGKLGDAACLSFFPTKNLGGFGDGGMVVTDDAELMGRVEFLRRQGSKKKYHSDEVGLNSRLDEMQAAIIRVKLRHFDAWQERRRAIANLYIEALSGSDGLQCPVVRDNAVHSFHQFTIEVADREGLQAYLKDQGIMSTIYYPVPLHQQGWYSANGLEPVSVPVTEAATARVLSLPMFPELPLDDAKRVADAVLAFVAKN
ncbi:MAG: DegT/DnrJ/EryC1/StrS family aminotransferase [Magnetovibrionaceae bacterium]